MQLRSRATTLQQHVWTAEQLEAVTLRIMRAEYPLDLRLMGVRYAFRSARCVLAGLPCSSGPLEQH